MLDPDDFNDPNGPRTLGYLQARLDELVDLLVKDAMRLRDTYYDVQHLLAELTVKQRGATPN